MVVMERSHTHNVPPSRIEGKEIENPAQFMFDNGIVFELNRILFHQLGLVLLVRPDNNGRPELALFDCSRNPVMVFEPTVFQRGQDKWRRFYSGKGIKAQQLRKRQLGITVQTRANYRDQSDYRR